MIRVMIDTDELDKLGARVELLATYADLVPDLAELQAKYPHSQVVLIDRGEGDPQNLASVMDIERGALTAADIPAWMDRKEKAGVEYRTVYCDRSTLPAVDQHGANLTFYRWVATLDGTAHIDGFPPLEGPAAVQCLSAEMLGYHADLSLVYDEGWHRPREPRWLRDSIDLAAGIRSRAASLHSDAMTLDDLLSAHR